MTTGEEPPESDQQPIEPPWAAANTEPLPPEAPAPGGWRRYDAPEVPPMPPLGWWEEFKIRLGEARARAADRLSEWFKNMWGSPFG